VLGINLSSLTQGVALGWSSRTPSALGTDSIRPSVPNVALVILDFVSFQESAEFILKRLPPVVLFLVRHITLNLLNMRLTDGEGSVPALPPKLGIATLNRLDPSLVEKIK